MVKYGKLDAAWISYSSKYDSEDGIVLKESDIKHDDKQTGSNNSGPFNIKWEADCNSSVNVAYDKIMYTCTVECKCGREKGKWTHGAEGTRNIDATYESVECKRCGKVTICFETFANSIGDVFQNGLTVVSAVANPGGFAVATAIELALQAVLKTLPEDTQANIQKVRDLKDIVTWASSLKTNPTKLKDLPKMLKKCENFGIKIDI